uniref:WD_REPEATS_REGION domain-containing protein n=1 Tax=Caenorhabditis japonica TaxID=281687 RepID=A0A8R1HZR6_CAEJA
MLISIALHPNKILIASGQSSCHSTDKSLKTEHTSPVESPEELVKQLELEHTEAHVRIWDSVKLTTLTILSGFDKGICHVSFSQTNSGAHLAVVDDSLRHMLSVWSWQKGSRDGEVKVASDVVFECKWHPTIQNLLVAYGRGHFSFFPYNPATGVLTKTVATFEAHSVHPGGVYALALAKSGKLLSGGKDRMISEWDVNDLVRSRRPIEGAIGDLSALEICGTNQLIATSQCGTVRVWNIVEKKVDWTKKFIDAVECMDIDATNTHLILGFSGGTWQVINIAKQQTIEEKREGTVAVTAVKFTPTGSTFAVATKEPSLILYRIDVSKNLLVVSRIHQLPSPIIAIDFSQDCQHLRAQSSGAHLLFWSKTGEACEGSELRDVKWATSRVRLGFETALVAHSSNGQISSVSQTEDLVAAGMENGTVRLYRNPVTSVTAGFVELLGHGKLVKSVCFASKSKSQLFSCSPTDNSIFEWSLE